MSQIRRARAHVGAGAYVAVGAVVGDDTTVGDGARVGDGNVRQVTGHPGKKEESMDTSHSSPDIPIYRRAFSDAIRLCGETMTRFDIELVRAVVVDGAARARAAYRAALEELGLVQAAVAGLGESPDYAQRGHLLLSYLDAVVEHDAPPVASGLPDPGAVNWSDRGAYWTALAESESYEPPCLECAVTHHIYDWRDCVPGKGCAACQERCREEAKHGEPWFTAEWTEDWKETSP